MQLWSRRVPSYSWLAIVGVVLLTSARLSATTQNIPPSVSSMDGLTQGPAQLSVWSRSRVVGSELLVTMLAENRDTVPKSFSFRISCEDEVKLYRDTTRSGPSLAFRLKGIQSGRVEVTLAPGQLWHQGACAPLPLSQLVQEDGRPAPPGVYYVALDLGRSIAGPRLTGIVAIGAYTTDTVTVTVATSPIKLIGTSTVVDSTLHIFITALNTNRWPAIYESAFCDFARGGEVLLYRDAAHSSLPFRYVPNRDRVPTPRPTVTPPRISTSYWLVPGEASTGDCDQYPITQLKQGKNPITPGTYYVVYKKGNPELDPRAFDVLNLGTVTIP